MLHSLHFTALQCSVKILSWKLLFMVEPNRKKGNVNIQKRSLKKQIIWLSKSLRYSFTLSPKKEKNFGMEGSKTQIVVATAQYSSLSSAYPITHLTSVPTSVTNRIISKTKNFRSLNQWLIVFCLVSESIVSPENK